MGDLTAHFSRNEFASRWEQTNGTVIIRQVPDNLLPNVKRLAKNLEVIRAEWGLVLIPGSSYRPPAHNAAIGGAKFSQHLSAKATDFVIPGVSKDDIYCTIRRLMASGKIDDGGLGYYGPGGHIHYDWDPKRPPWKGDKVATFPACTEEDDVDEVARKQIAALTTGLSWVVAATAQNRKQIGQLTTGLSWVGAALNNHLAEGDKSMPNLPELLTLLGELKATQIEIEKQARESADWIERVTSAATG